MKRTLNQNEIAIKLNDESFSYDVYQMFNIYYQNLKIKFDKEEFQYEVIIRDEEIMVLWDNEEWKRSLKGCENIKEEVRKAIFSFLREETGSRYPWGTLTGIRPSKRAMKLIEQGKDSEYIIKEYDRVSLTEKEKAQLCIDIALNERELIEIDNKTISVYIGMPYCPSKCVYCSFTSNPIPRKGNQVEQYISTLKREIEKLAESIKDGEFKIDTVYFGGGTPTAVNDAQFDEVMRCIHDEFIQNFEVREFTVECGRVDSLNEEKLKCMKENDVTRISINPQTMNDETLKRIGRTHDSEDVKKMFKIARDLGLNNINMDLIVGLPGEGINEIKHTCNEIKELSPESITVHGLSVKRGSVLYEKFITNEKIYIPHQEEIIDMFNEVKELSEGLEMIPYYMYRQKNMLGNMENIGYAKKGSECIYNIAMIEDTQTIVAVGANGISKFLLQDGIIQRIGNNKDVITYMDKVEEITSEKINFLNRL